MWNLFSVVVFHRSMVNWRGYICPQYMCILVYVKLIWCSSIPYIYGQLEVGYICPKYMCILLYVKLLWCSSIPYIYGQLKGGTSALSICAYCYMWNLFSVVVFHRSMVNWRRGPWYMCILLYVKLIWCSGILEIYGWLEGGTYARGICAFCYMLNFFGVAVFHTSMVNWRGVHLP